MPLCLMFINLKKAFNTVETEAVLEALGNQGVPTQYIRIFRELYSNFTTRISPFYDDITIDIRRGVRQSDTVSPKLFTATLNHVMRGLEWDNMGVRVDGRLLHRLRFAHDIVLITPNISQAERMLADYDDACGKIGLQLNLAKTIFVVKQCHNNDITSPCAMEGRAFSVENDEREENELLMRAAAPRLFLPRRDPMEMLSDERFREQFRLTRRGFAFVLSLLEDDLQSSTRRSAALTPAQKLSIFMDVFGSASIQRKTYGYSQATVSRVIAEVSDVLYNRREEFIHWPDEDRLAETRMAFFDSCGIPEVVGAIDGTHIKIIAPVVDEDSYVNRKDYHSLNLSIISDANQRIKDRYTNAVCAGRAVVERAIGALKRQFFMLHLELRYEPERCAKIIIACCALRNVCIELKEPEFELQRPVEEEIDDFFIQDNEAPRDSAAGAAMRQHIIDTYFS
ncbi:hypothetical protein ANCCEY_14407 [Ancylostoma ceylanicum]|uniref:Reverse transcriptase domain-containing protein n=1 Tax=Ancylostoma ceylanicum TaxID=53326 RepID=A0A0D6L6M5_9BILA|nr:hypothetical protein ANCCEY_14407 [Ancylostoma ceylanicum]